ncbi:site-specific integrase [Mucilaginibacter sp. 44-25]|uniref:tyrosine-type recombinase/integrase n=1 Tax=Mucilaginibacter sp. 44-25 TaxID=1895794 RepID=UPI00096905AA|nr:site-specific integrase [Mucilaginibacter sp. 44-25]OJW17982.1 MAG: integrase [Mucilaginibacter sp. 44-25]
MAKVHIRKKALTKGRQSIYLDYSPPLRNPKTGKPQRYEFLDLFTYEKPANILQRRHNAETMELVEHLRASRLLDIQNRKYGFVSDRDRSASFVDYFREFICNKTNSDCDNNAMSFRYFIAFAGHDLLFNDLDEFLCEDYKNFMLGGPGISRRGRSISRNTAASYFAKFRNTLKRAYKKGLLTIDLHNQVDPIKLKETHREQLELEEFQRLVDTPSKSDLIKRAAICSGLTGLRFSDIQTMYWSEVRGTPGRYYLQFTQEKTEGAEILPISDQAVDVMGKRGQPGDRVFAGLAYSSMRLCFKDWLLNAGITKNITFHSFRHTYATLQLEAGTELLTVSKMLGHKSIKTTLIYTKVKDKMKIEAAGRIKLNLKSMKRDNKRINQPK